MDKFNFELKSSKTNVTIDFLKNQPKAKIVINRELQLAIKNIVANCHTEVTWQLIGKKVIDKEGNITLYLTKYYIPKQKCHSTTTETDPEDIGVLDLLEENESILVWAHSHVHMGVPPSKQDWDTLKETILSVDPTQIIGYTMMIVNKKSEMYLAMFSGKDYIRDVKLEIDVPEDEIPLHLKMAELEQQLFELEDLANSSIENKDRIIKTRIDALLKEKVSTFYTAQSKLGEQASSAKNTAISNLHKKEERNLAKKTHLFCTCNKYPAYVCAKGCYTINNV